MQFEIPFNGHENIRSLHNKTIEITKDSKLTPGGDCIIGIKANSGCKDIPNQIKKKIKKPDSKIVFSIIVNGDIFEINGEGHKEIGRASCRERV